jgi:hypothetical protein
MLANLAMFQDFGVRQGHAPAVAIYSHTAPNSVRARVSLERRGKAATVMYSLGNVLRNTPPRTKTLHLFLLHLVTQTQACMANRVAPMIPHRIPAITAALNTWNLLTVEKDRDISQQYAISYANFREKLDVRLVDSSFHGRGAGSAVVSEKKLTAACLLVSSQTSYHNRYEIYNVLIASMGE